ncbi:hypothetical protein KMT30_02600 [Streptomyces sp. IBSBF 2953]|nr:hypothetical protein [Streptomyces hayashii]
MGFTSWEAYCDAEFSISHAQAYRLLDVARTLAAIHGAVAVGTETSRTRDSGPAAATALDYGLSPRSDRRLRPHGRRGARPPAASPRSLTAA